MKKIYTPTLEQDNLQECFEPFARTPRIKKHQDGYVDFIEDVDFTIRGIEAILELLERSLLDRDVNPELNRYQEGVLIVLL